MNDNEPISDKFRGFTQQFHTLTARLAEEERDLVTRRRVIRYERALREAQPNKKAARRSSGQ